MTRARVLVALATLGSVPKNRRAGKVMRVPPPATALTAPPAAAARARPAIWVGGMGWEIGRLMRIRPIDHFRAITRNCFPKKCQAGGRRKYARTKNNGYLGAAAIEKRAADELRSMRITYHRLVTGSFGNGIIRVTVCSDQRYGRVDSMRRLTNQSIMC